MEIIKTPAPPRCTLCNGVENVTPFHFTTAAVKLLAREYGGNPESFNAGICARCEALSQDERRALVEMGIKQLSIEIMVSAGVPLATAQREVANLDVAQIVRQGRKQS